MGLLVKGQWQDHWYDTRSSGGRFVRDESRFRDWITSDGKPVPERELGFRAEGGRYHLYLSLACPWAHRTLIFLKLKGLEELISYSIVEPHMLENGWEFCREHGFSGLHQQGATADPLYQSEFLYQIYLRARPDYSGRVTVPVLWDKQNQTIVSNESSEIIRMFNQAFDGLTGNRLDFYPNELQAQIDELNAWIYERVNNGVYRAGFATSQQAYQEAVHPLFEALDVLEQKLSIQRYLLGEVLTEADWRLFTTLIRFDAVYVGHFKTNLKRIADYPHLQGWLKELYQYPGIRETVNFNHIKQHYYYSHQQINPTRVVPAGPELDLDSPHGREKIG
ncbi:glutathione S-transferase family protein [Dongshaea marina]|uniref:glutathione S-transferase family protein n=1 Tax=Dongshaea marina TaxID=2047966 RepID=UPI000D3E3F6A|nr:glutathione S-transferase family protein [Dongshaea marina]